MTLINDCRHIFNILLPGTDILRVLLSLENQHRLRFNREQSDLILKWNDVYMLVYMNRL